MLAWVKGGKTGGNYNRPYFDGVLSWDHGMVYSIGQAGRHTLITFRADPAFHAAVGLGSCLLFGKSQRYFFEVALSLRNGYLPHGCPRQMRFAFCIGLFIGPILLSSLLEISPVQIAVNTLSCIFPASHSLYHGLGPIKDIPTGKDPFYGSL
ncbi:hypothetical protein ES703_104348 [subsurface metagenome]